MFVVFGGATASHSLYTDSRHGNRVLSEGQHCRQSAGRPTGRAVPLSDHNGGLSSLYSHILDPLSWSYMFTYQMKGVFLDTAYLALVSNGKKFQTLNSRWLNFPSIETTFFWWHWWRSPAKYLVLCRRILNISKRKNSILNTVCHFHPLFWSIRLSSQLRGRLYVFSHFAELLVVFLILLIVCIIC